MRDTVQRIERKFRAPTVWAQSINFSSIQSCWRSETLSVSLTAVYIYIYILPVPRLLTATGGFPFKNTFACSFFFIVVQLLPHFAACGRTKRGKKEALSLCCASKLPETWASPFQKPTRQQVFTSRTGDSEASTCCAAPSPSSPPPSPPSILPPIARCCFLVGVKRLKPHQTEVNYSSLPHSYKPFNV